jgi:hypothetical protein
VTHFKTLYWVAWLIVSVLLGAYLTWSLVSDGDPEIYMPGPLSDGHHQYENRCEVCHTSSFGGDEVLQEACVECHGDQRRKPLDSHPRSKFTDPRNAETLDHLNALYCVTCHLEHKPEITAKNGVTQPKDVCSHCHKDVAEERPSHEGMAFDTCASSGCHNFHNNRALYTDFVLKHIDEPDLLESPLVPDKEFVSLLSEITTYPKKRYPVRKLAREDADAGDYVTISVAIATAWHDSGHASSGVNCTACHMVEQGEENNASWMDKPPMEVCTQCHELEVKQFGLGKHGMRIAEGMPPMRPELARLPMKEEAAHSELTCNSCHGAHDYDVRKAAVEACLDCHDDRHTSAYEGTPHHETWLAEMQGDAPPNSGVSCATCHLPRTDMEVNDWMSRITVNHNQSDVHSPNSQMLRPACLHCHGMEFSLNALADRVLIDRNFDAAPGVTVETMELARKESQRRKEEGGEEDEDAGMFGF